MKSCRDITKLALGGAKLSLWGKMTVAMHLMMCRACRRFKNQTKAIDEAVRTRDEKVYLDEAARERIKNILSDE